LRLYLCSWLVFPFSSFTADRALWRSNILCSIVPWKQVCLSLFQRNGQFCAVKEVKYINCIDFNKRVFPDGQDTLFSCPTFALLLISVSLPQYIIFETPSDSDACLYSISRSPDTYEFYDRHTPISQHYALIYMTIRSTCAHFTADCASVFKHALRFI
jgi:hypothetical protein